MGPFFQIDDRAYLETALRGIAPRQMKFIQQAVGFGRPGLMYVVTFGVYPARGLSFAPVEFDLVFEIILIAVVHVCHISVGFLTAARPVGQLPDGVLRPAGKEICRRGAAPAGVSVLETGGIDSELAGLSHSTDVVDCGAP